MSPVLPASPPAGTQDRAAPVRAGSRSTIPHQGWSTSRRAARAGAAGAAILVLMTAVPVGLVRLSTTLPLDLSALSPAGLARPDDGALVMLVLVAIAWASWGILATSLVVELVAVLRGVPTPRIPCWGLPQRMASVLVSALLVGALPVGASAEPPEHRPDLAATVQAVQVDVDHVLALLDGRGAPVAAADRPGGDEEQRSAGLPTIATQRHDTLWLLAEQYLGSGERFAEIVDLNLGVTQADGRALRADGRIYPGWVLRVPADADLRAHRPDRHVVGTGDTLWDIAQEELGDPTRYPEIVAANRGDVQPDGRQLQDPGLILPGWVLELPPAGSSGRSNRAEGSAGTRAPGAAQNRDEAPAGGARDADRPAQAQRRVRAETPEDGESAVAAGDAAAAALEGRGSTGPTNGASPDEPAPAAGPADGAAPASAVVDDAPDLAGPAEAFTTRPPEAQPAPPGSGAPVGSGTVSAPGLGGVDRPGAAHPSGWPTSAHGEDEATHPRGEKSTSAGTQPVDPTPSSNTAIPPISEPTQGMAQSPREWATEGAQPEGAQPGEVAGVAAPGWARSMLPAGGAVAALLVGALGVQLARRRAQFLRWRRPGEHLARPSVRAARLEASLAAVAPTRAGQLIGAAQSVLAPSGSRVRMIEIGLDDVVVHLTDDLADPPMPFESRKPRVLWASRDAVERSGSSAPASLDCALVTVGTRGDRAVLLDLETVGTLRLAGDDRMVGAVLRAMAAEVALDPRLSGFTRTLCLRDPRIAAAAEAGEVIVDADAQRVGRAVATAIRRAHGAPGEAPSSAGPASGAGGPRGGWSVGSPLDDPGASRVGHAQPTGRGLATLEGPELVDVRTPPWDFPGWEVADGASAEVSGSQSRGRGQTGDGSSAQGAAASAPGHLVVEHPDPWLDPFEIVLTDRALDCVVPAYCGVGLISSAAPAGAGSTLCVLEQGRAVLVEDGLELAPVGLSTATVDDLVELFSAADLPGDLIPQAGAPTAPEGSSRPGPLPDSSVSTGYGSPEGRRSRGSGVAEPRAADEGGAGAPEGSEAAEGAGRPEGARAVAAYAAPTCAGPGSGGDLSGRASAGGSGHARGGPPTQAEAVGPDAGPGTGGDLSGRASAGGSGHARGGPPTQAEAAGPDAGPGTGGDLSGRASAAGSGHARGGPPTQAEAAGPDAVAATHADRPAAVPMSPPDMADVLTSRPEMAVPRVVDRRRGELDAGLASSAVPRLLVLGDVEVENARGRAESARIGRLAETAAFVLLHPGARPSELLAALWPGRTANPQSCRQMISRTRSWLGRTDDGEPYLEPFARTNGRLRLRPEVGSDWDDFQALAARGMTDPEDVDNLTAALELVRGRPFGSLWRRELAWADVDGHRMMTRIIDVAHELALRHEAAGRIREARAAVHRAMRTQAESELLDELLERLTEP